MASAESMMVTVQQLAQSVALLTQVVQKLTGVDAAGPVRMPFESSLSMEQVVVPEAVGNVANRHKTRKPSSVACRYGASCKHLSTGCWFRHDEVCSKKGSVSEASN